MKPLGKAQRRVLQALADGGWITSMSGRLYEAAPAPLNYRLTHKVPLSIIDALYDRGYIKIDAALVDGYRITEQGRAAL